MKKNLYLLFSIILISLFSSCNFITSIFAPEKEDKEIGEFEDINIFDSSLLPVDNSFTTLYSLCGDKDYLYAITNGSQEYPGKVVKVSKMVNHPLLKIY